MMRERFISSILVLFVWPALFCMLLSLTASASQPYWCPDLSPDDKVDFLDFSVLAGNWNKSGTDIDGDFDASGTVDIYDLERLAFWWLEKCECKNADINFDHIVNFSDFAIFAENWLKTGSNLDGDFDYSGKVDEIDLSNLGHYWLNEHPLVAEDLDASVTENQAVVIVLNAYDCNESGNLTFEIISTPQNGIVAADANRAIYCPDINYVGEDYFTYIAKAGGSQSNIARAFITVLADTDDDSLSDYDELNGTFGYVTDPYDANTDADGMPDGWEVNYNLNPVVSNGGSNPDNDGLTNLEEYNSNTHPLEADTDCDGLKDGDELSGNLSSYGPIWPYDNSYPDYYYTPFVSQPYDVPLDPLNPDTDSDGIIDYDEIKWGLDPNNPDTDGDGVDDNAETSYDNNAGFFRPWPLWNYLYNENLDDCDMNPNDDDTDSDGMNDKWEYENQRIDCPSTRVLDPRYGSDPGNDTDYDDLINSIECSQNLSSKYPDGWDTDGDGLSDGEEYYGTVTGYVTNPNDIDSDDDFLIDGYNNIVPADSYPGGIHEYYGGSSSYVFGETSFGTNPVSQHTDSDNMPDGWEVRQWNMHTHSYFDPTYNYSGVPDLDFDGDSLTNLTESQEWTLAWFGDTDNDGANDGDEKNTLQTNPLNSDTDGDGLKDGQEGSHSADPHDYDTDNDLLADGWEVENNMDPAVSDVYYVDSNGNNVYWDPDVDGLDDFEEFIYGTNPKDSDSDNDGVEDGDEINQGSNPLDNGDKVAPPANQICRIKLTVGDHSGSNSERYILQVGSVRHMSTEFGEVQSRIYKFKTGQPYTVKILHVDSTLEEPDYDYTAKIEKVEIPAGAIFYTHDPEKILGVHGDLAGTTKFHAQGKTATMALFRPTHTSSYEGNLREQLYYQRKYYHQIYEGDTLINLPGIPCDEDIRWEKNTPWYIKWLNITGGDVTKEYETDYQWYKSKGYAIMDEMGCPYYLAIGVSSVQTISVCGVEVPPKYIMYFDLSNNKKIWKVPANN